MDHGAGHKVLLRGGLDHPGLTSSCHYRYYQVLTGVAQGVSNLVYTLSTP